MRDGPECRSCVCRERREEINKTRGIMSPRNVLVLIVIEIVLESLRDFVRLVAGLSLSDRLFLWFGSRSNWFGIERYAVLYGAIGVEFSSVSDLKADLFLIFVLADHKM